MSDKRKLGSIRVLGDGRYQLRISDGFDDFGKRRQFTKIVTCSSEREAEKELVSFYANREKFQRNERSVCLKLWRTFIMNGLLSMFLHWRKIPKLFMLRTGKTIFSNMKK